MAAKRIGELFRAHWFFPAAALVASGAFIAASQNSWASPAAFEAGIVFDLSVFIPLLYWWCYRARGRAALLRAMALACFGLWLAGHAVPTEHHRLLGSLSFLRYVGLAVLLAVELKLGILIYRAAFQRDEKAAPAAFTAAREAGMPEWVVRLMNWEAGLWRKVWHTLRGVFGRKEPPDQ